MLTGQAAPGVYYQVVDASAHAITGVRTDVAGFVGIAERGPVDVPVPIESWRQFQAHFGGFTGSGFLAYAVRAFFENGGLRCWVVRIASRDPRAGAASAGACARNEGPPAGPPVWRIAASSPGAWGDRVTVRLVVTHRAQTTGDLSRSAADYTRVAAAAGFERGTLVRLTQPGSAPLYRVVHAVDAAAARLVWRSDRREQALPYDRAVTGLDPVRPLTVESIELTLAVSEAGRPVAVYEALSLIPEHPRYGPALLAPFAPPRFEGERTAPSAPAPITIEERRTPYQRTPGSAAAAAIAITLDDIPTPAVLSLRGGRDGLALLRHSDLTGDDEAGMDDDATRVAKRRGFRALSTISEVAIIAVPDIHVRPLPPPEFVPPPVCLPDPCLPPPPLAPASPAAPLALELPPVFSEADVYRVQADLVRHCEEMRDRVALLDPPFDAAHDAGLGTAAVRAWRARFDSRHGALYHPWVRVVDALRGGGSVTRSIPASGHIAGQFARTDTEVGVHKAPANAPLAWIQDVTAAVNDVEHGLLNGLGINVIRPLPGRGLRIMGARTVSSDTAWRFVNVRRLVLMIMKAVDLSTQWAVFEPNDALTRAKLRIALISYLGTLWQRGMLAGNAPEEAFFVKCDDENNPASERGEGRLLAEIGVAPAQPFEFVVVRVWRTGNELEFQESVAQGGR